MILREAVLTHGFKPLVDEPYPDTCLTLPTNSDSMVEAN